MPGSFDKELTIDEHKCLTPAGPLGLAPGETVSRLDIWVFQKGARVNPDEVAAACVAFLPGPFQGERWKANPDPNNDHFGEGFEPGPAIGMGLMVKKNEKEETIVEQWRKDITLK
jgi:hypothetical protein